MAEGGQAGSWALCIKMGFTWTFLGKQNAEVELKFEILVIY